MYQKLLKIILLYLLLMTGIYPIYSQSVTGKVMDQDHDPLPGVNIFLKNDLLTGTTTDAQGHFELKVNNPGDTIVLSFIGYQKQTLPIMDIDQPLIIQMKSSKTAMNEIIIHDQRLVAEGFDQLKISKMDIYNNPAAKADPLLAINTIPSATNLDESANVRLRGGLPQETAIFFDGVPVYDAIRYGQLNGIGTFSIFNTAIIDEVRVFPGAAPLEYGSNTSGLVAISSEDDLVNSSYTDFLLSLASIGVNHRSCLSENSGIRLFANYQPSNLLINLNQEALQNLKNFSSADVGLHLTKAFEDNWQMKFFNYSNVEGYDFKLEEAGSENIVSQNKRRNLTTFNLSKILGNVRFNFNQGLSFSKQSFGYKRSDTKINRQNSFSSLNVHQVRKKSEWKAGINLDLQAQQYSAFNYQVPFATGPEHPMVAIEEESTLNQVELFIYRKRNFGENFKIGSGISINQSGKIGTNLMLSYKINAHHQLRFTESSARRRFLADQFINFNYEIRSDNFALEYIFEKSGHELSFSGYWHRKEYAGDEVKVSGLEIYHQMDLNRFNLNWSFSFLNYLEGIQQYQNLQSELVDLDYFFRSAMNWKITSSLQLGLNTIYRQGGMYFPILTGVFNPEWQVYEPIQSQHPDRLEDYFIIDINLSNRFLLLDRWPMIAFVSVSNVLNTKNTRDYQYDQTYQNPEPVLFGQRVFYAGFNLALSSN